MAEWHKGPDGELVKGPRPKPRIELPDGVVERCLVHGIVRCTICLAPLKVPW